ANPQSRVIASSTHSVVVVMIMAVAAVSVLPLCPPGSACLNCGKAGSRGPGRPRDMAENFDTIIVGGGAAGCVLANRLSAGSGHSVLLLEAGRDTPPGGVPDDIADTYPASYYNPGYFWPEM